ncbi:MAG TPA: serine hydrolase domain-containing protein [Candidatus Limnocylindria bacterium]|nr:serine hydrolase domain-containing protein [Candidatus Limnocylindria bacterium]
MHLARHLLVVVAVTVAGLSPLRAEPSATTSTNVAPLLQPFVDRHELAGAVALVIGRDRVLDVECVGFADLAAQRPMTPDTLFWIASQSKPMTATAVLMLVDEGKIALDDPVEKYLPEFRGQPMIAGKDGDHVTLRAPSRPITLRDVLSHMSGLPFQSILERPTLDGLPLAAAVRSYAKTPLQWEPGTRYQYSNAGINTAARILEVVSGMPYEKFMQRRLFGPLGMTDTTFWPNEKQLRRLAKSYRPDASMTGLGEFPISQLQYPLSDRQHRYPMPAGGLFSTAGDTAKFCQMLLNGGELHGRRYLSPAAFGELTRRQTPPTVSDSYGLGLSAGGDWFGHGGAHATGMEIRPRDGYAVVWMVQHGGFPGDGGQAQGVFKDWAHERFAGERMK